MSDVPQRITAYLTGGGLFNPEMANHDAVRDLLIAAKAEVARLVKDYNEVFKMADEARNALYEIVGECVHMARADEGAVRCTEKPEDAYHRWCDKCRARAVLGK